MAPGDIPRNNKNPFRITPILTTIFVIVFVYLLSDARRFQGATDTIPYSQFLGYLKQNKILDVTLGNDTVEGQLKPERSAVTDKPGPIPVPDKNPHYFVTNRVNDPGLVARLEAAGVKFSGLREGGGFWSGIVSWLFTLIFLFAIWSFLLKKSSGISRGGGFLSLGKSKAKIYVETDLKTRFEDVAGVDEAKEELREVVNFLKEPARYTTLGGRMPKGVLLVGPPGTGKTLLARAAAGEAGVPFFSINGSEFVEMFVGLGAARVRDLFEQARSQAPCIIFIDELDALGKARSIGQYTGGANDEKEQTLNQLLAEMDGFDSSRGVVLVGATNRPEILDPALLRAGRFDRSILVDRPDRVGRRQILAVHSTKVKLAKAVDLDALASMTAGFSGADLANLVNEAALVATRRLADSVTQSDFTIALERIVAGLERKSRLLSPHEKLRVAYHEMGHAVVALALGQGQIIHKVSIIPRGIGSLGYTLSRPTEDRYLMEKNELEAKIAIAMGGRASERKFFKDISTGAGDDLDKATEIARAMVTRFGMSEAIGPGVYEREPTQMLGGHGLTQTFAYSEKTAQFIDTEVRKLLDSALQQATQVIDHYPSLIKEAVDILLEKETLDEASLTELWHKHQDFGPQLLSA
jgi:cell division protease FtsH